MTALVDYGDGSTGVLVTAVHDFVGTDRFEILGDNGKIVVENSKTRHGHPAEQAGARDQRRNERRRREAGAHRPTRQGRLLHLGSDRVRLGRG